MNMEQMKIDYYENRIYEALASNSEHPVDVCMKLIQIIDESDQPDKLFKIVVFEGYIGSLDNGIKTGMLISKALEKDSSLCYDDWNEDYESDGYWIEEDNATSAVSSISIFIPEVLNDEVFEQYCW